MVKRWRIGIPDVPTRTELQQQLTDLDIASIEQDQQLTDLDIRVLELEMK